MRGKTITKTLSRVIDKFLQRKTTDCFAATFERVSESSEMIRTASLFAHSLCKKMQTDE